MKKKVLICSLISFLGLSLLGVGIASAHGFSFGWFGTSSNLTPDQIATNQQTMFQNEATILGISIDDVKNAWAEGTSLQQLIKDKGIDQTQVQQRIKDAQIQQLKTQLQVLVDKGVITQAQSDKRLKLMQDKLQNTKVKGHKGMMGWGMRGLGFKKSIKQ